MSGADLPVCARPPGRAKSNFPARRGRSAQACRPALLAFAGLLAAAAAFAQAPSIQPPEPVTPLDRLRAPYTALHIPTFQAGNSPRLRDLMSAGTLRLSLRDAIALAVENNLDVEVQRFTLLLAETDLMRTQGGGVARGLPYTIGEVAPGIGGPAGSLLNVPGSRFSVNSSILSNLAEIGILAGSQSNLSILGPQALSIGTAVPNYDPYLGGQFNFNHQTTPQNSLSSNGLDALVTSTTLANAGIQQGFSSGAQAGLAFNNSRQNLNSLKTSYNPFATSSLGLTVTQPLLRGFGRRVNQRYMRIAGNQQRITSLLFQQQLIATVYGVTRLYIDLAAIHEDIAVKEQTLALAERLFADTKAQVEEGTLPEIELTRANAQIASARQDLLAARGLHDEQEAILKSVIARSGLNDPEVAAAQVQLADTLEAPSGPAPASAAEMLERAFSHRPDLLQAGLQLRNTEISLEGAHSALLPQVDLVGLMQNSGLAGTMNLLAGTPSAGLTGGYGTALEQLLARNYPTYGVGLNVTLPLRNRVAQADLARDEVQLRQSQARAAQLRNQARLEIEAALIALRRTRAAYQAAVETRRLQEESLAAERARFEEGLSTGFFVMQYQNLAAQARSTEVIARAAWHKARAALLRATGEILDESGIAVEKAMPLR
jgi:outer membrane protein